MKTCLNCMTTTTNNNLEKCNVCGSSNFRAGRPKTGYKMDPSEVNEEASAAVDDNDNVAEVHHMLLHNTIPTEDTTHMTREEHIEMHNSGIDYSGYSDDVTLGKWIGTLILLAIPVVGIVYAIVKIVKKSENITYTNYLKAQLIISVVSAILGFIFSGIIVNSLVNMLYYMY